MLFETFHIAYVQTERLNNEETILVATKYSFHVHFLSYISIGSADFRLLCRAQIDLSGVCIYLELSYGPIGHEVFKNNAFNCSQMMRNMIYQVLV